MKLFLLCFSSIIIISCGQRTEKISKIPCSKFRTGVFYNSAISGVADTKITREDDYQIEESIRTGAIARFRVIWKDSCSYQLIFESGNETAQRTLRGMTKSNVQILETKYNSYVAETWMDGDSRKIKSELTVEK